MEYSMCIIKPTEDAAMKKWNHSCEPIEGGVRIKNSRYYFDYTYNAPGDLIDIVEPQIYATVHNNNVYRFGYRFNESASSSDRTKFIHSIKQIGDNPLSNDQLEQFIKRPLKYLNDEVNLYKIDCLVYPLSQRSPLVSKMIKCINEMTSHHMHRCSFELVKQAPQNIEFDFDLFESEHGDEQGYQAMLKHVNETLLPKLRSLDYFSIAQNVKSKYRPYITGFIDFSNMDDIEKFSKFQGTNILVVDDINTTGSTLNEILRKLGELNNNCNIFVYTLLGK